MLTIDDFLMYLQGDRAYSPRSIRTYADALDSFQNFFQTLDDQLDWDKIDADIIRRWMAAEMERGIGARTVAKNLSALRSFYKYLLRMGCVSKNPAHLIKNPKVHYPLPTFLKQSEMNRLFDDVEFPESFEGVRDRIILLTFYHTGVRVSELVGLNVADVSLTTSELKVTGKRNKQRIIPFGKELNGELTHYVRLRNEWTATLEGPLFLGKDKKRMKAESVRNIVSHYLSMVTTQKKKSPHVLRHTFATVMLNNGADLEAIKELLGHESIGTTEVYTHTTFADLKKEYEQAHPRA